VRTIAILAALSTLAVAVPGATQNTAPTAQKLRERTDRIDFDVLHAQVILDHLGYSPGVLDGRRGMSFVNALEGFQESRGIEVTGELDRATIRALRPFRAVRPVKRLTLTEGALSGPYVANMPESPEEQARLDRLGYRSPMEKLAEMFHTTPRVLLELNSPDTRLAPSEPVLFPNALPTSRDYPSNLPQEWRDTLSDLNVDASQPEAARIVVDKSDGVLRVFDESDRLVAQFTATMGSEHDPLPIGRWEIVGEAYNPPFNYNPELFWDVSDSEAKVTLPPGPNGPVGVVWIDLSKEHYGIHGTAEPTTIGRAQSHGCIRLTNWDAARLAMMVAPGTPAVFQE